MSFELVCLICGKEFTEQTEYRKLSGHILSAHKITPEDYYKKYIGLGKCHNSKCENSTEFLDIRRGFKQYCSVKCANSCEDKIKRTEEHTLKKYGVKNASSLKSTREKVKGTCMERYGVEYHTQRTEFINDVNIERKLVKRNAKFIKNGVRWIGDGSDGKYKMHCETCNTSYEIHPKTLSSRLKFKIPLCVNCVPLMSSASQYEVAIFRGLSVLNERMLTNRRHIIPPMELDIYIPRLKVAVEFNGLYWHSNANKEDRYHEIKNNMCHNKNIRVVQIYEDDWVDHGDIILQKIKDIIRSDDIGYHMAGFGRGTIGLCSTDVAKSFIANNDVWRGQCNWDSVISVGEVVDGDMVSLMAVNMNGTDCVIEYFGYKLGHSLGGFPSIVNFVKNELTPTTITYNADRSWISERDIPLFNSADFDMVLVAPPCRWNVIHNKRCEYNSPESLVICNSGYLTFKWGKHEV